MGYSDREWKQPNKLLKISTFPTETFKGWETDKNTFNFTPLDILHQKGKTRSAAGITLVSLQGSGTIRWHTFIGFYGKKKLKSSEILRTTRSKKCWWLPMPDYQVCNPKPLSSVHLPKESLKLVGGWLPMFIVFPISTMTMMGWNGNR